MGKNAKRGRVNIIGGGPAGLMAAEMLSPDWDVQVYEKGKAVGRKFLVAGKGGFNLTNSAVGETLEQVYWPPDFLRNTLQKFDSQALRTWLAELGIPTFIGSSGRVFPKRGIKPIEVLQHWLQRLQQREVQFNLQHRFISFTEDWKVKVENQEGEILILEADYTIFALGGASWSVTGSTGAWLPAFAERGVPTTAFAPSNCGIELNWPAAIREHHAGKPLKNIALMVDGQQQKGEATITEYGLEGNAIYPLVRLLRAQLAQGKASYLTLDLKPRNSPAQLLDKISGKEARNFGQALRLDGAAMAIVKAFCNKETFLDPTQLSKALKQISLPVLGLRPIEEAISTVGGIDRSAVNANFSLRQQEGIFTIGEMLDWDAPTGGFLLQGCLAMGHSMRETLARLDD